MVAETEGNKNKENLTKLIPFLHKNKSKFAISRSLR